MPDPVDKRGQVTRVIEAMARGEAGKAEQLLELVYGELRAMAAVAMAREKPGRTLQPTALVHEAYLKLFGKDGVKFENRAHFFGAAGEAMRRILVDAARRRGAVKRGGGLEREDGGAGAEREEEGTPDSVDLLALDEALSRLEGEDPRMATIVKLRYFAEMTVDEAAAALGLSRRTVLREWIAAKAWLHAELGGGELGGGA